MATDVYGDKLDLILSELADIKATLGKAAPVPQVEPEGGLYEYRRPAAGVPRYGYGLRMVAPDANEARLRAMYSIKWNGEIARTGPYEDEVWAEIEALKSLDPGLVARYSMLDPDFAGFALLTGLFDVVKHDGFYGAANRESYAGWTVQSWLDQQFGVDSRPSGNDE